MTFELLNESILSTVEQSKYTAVRSSSQIGSVNEAVTPACLEYEMFYFACAVVTVIVIFMQLKHRRFRVTETVSLLAPEFFF